MMAQLIGNLLVIQTVSFLGICPYFLFLPLDNPAIMCIIYIQYINKQYKKRKGTMNTMMETNFVARQIVNEKIRTEGREPIVLAYPTRPLQKIAKRVMAFIRSIDEAMHTPMLASQECTLVQVGC